MLVDLFKNNHLFMKDILFRLSLRAMNNFILSSVTLHLSFRSYIFSSKFFNSPTLSWNISVISDCSSCE